MTGYHYTTTVALQCQTVNRINNKSRGLQVQTATHMSTHVPVAITKLVLNIVYAYEHIITYLHEETMQHYLSCCLVFGVLFTLTMSILEVRR